MHVAIGRVVAIVAMALSLVLAAASLSAAPRNVLLVIADDYGIDVTTYYPLADRQQTTPPAPKTPNLAKLAKAGLLFRNAWAQPSCSPSRATLLTGRYGFRTSIGEPVPRISTNPSRSSHRTNSPCRRRFQVRAGPRILIWPISGSGIFSRGIDDPRLFGWPYFSGPHPNLAHLPDYFTWPKVVNGVQTTSSVYATTDQGQRHAGERSAGPRRPAIPTSYSAGAECPACALPEAARTSYAPVTACRRPAAPRRAYYQAMIEAMDTEIGRLLKSVDLKTTDRDLHRRQRHPERGHRQALRFEPCQAPGLPAGRAGAAAHRRCRRGRRGRPVASVWSTASTLYADDLEPRRYLHGQGVARGHQGRRRQSDALRGQYAANCSGARHRLRRQVRPGRGGHVRAHAARSALQADRARTRACGGRCASSSTW